MIRVGRLALLAAVAVALAFPASTASDGYRQGAQMIVAVHIIRGADSGLIASDAARSPSPAALR